MIIAEFVYLHYYINRVYDSDTGFEVAMTPEVQAAAQRSLLDGAIVRVITCHNKITVDRAINTNKTTPKTIL